MERLQWIAHNGTHILFVDFSNMADEAQIIDLIIKIGEVIVQRDKVLYLIDISGSVGTVRIMDAYKKMLESVKHRISAFAVVGATGLKKVLLGGVKPLLSVEMKQFSTIQEAKEYLTHSRNLS
ncbi:MAG: STAS/SEC14 domain-containing protein [Nanobdellota archaeon]